MYAYPTWYLLRRVSVGRVVQVHGTLFADTGLARDPTFGTPNLIKTPSFRIKMATLEASMR